LAAIAFERRPWLWLAWAGVFAYVVYALQRLHVTWDRFVLGLGNAGVFLDRLFPPHVLQADTMVNGLLESVEVAILASFIGIVLSIPLGVLGARNLMPWWITLPVRFFVALCRSFHPMIVAIVFVKAVGFGAMAGILTLAVASMGFIGKLFTEAIEEISAKQVEAIRATGASFMSVLTYGVLPQVLSRFAGFATYQVDSNLRNSTMVGIVGAGGIGGTLFSAFQRFDYEFVCAIVLAIVAMIVLGEALARLIRRLLGIDAKAGSE
jgi:phosphonate transport system permease protein